MIIKREDTPLISVCSEEVARLSRLPNPLHLFATLTESPHYHFGFHVEGDSTGADSGRLARAMDRLSLRSLRFLQDRSRVLDVGCGMGGTVALLVDRGHDVVGVDPCERSIAYARSLLDGRSRHRLFACGLDEFAGILPEERFDALILIEVAHRFPSLGALLATSRELLEPGGILVLQDVALSRVDRALAIPFHERGCLARLGESMGFVVRHQEELTAEVAATPGALAQRLGAARRSLLELFEGSRPEIASEIEELRIQLEHLAEGFARQQLVYEEIVLQSNSSTSR